MSEFSCLCYPQKSAYHKLHGPLSIYMDITDNANRKILISELEQKYLARQMALTKVRYALNTLSN